jgi:hypothetical protein
MKLRWTAYKREQEKGVGREEGRGNEVTFRYKFLCNLVDVIEDITGDLQMESSS